MKNKNLKLKLSWWQELIYLLLVIGGPVITVYIAAMVHDPKPKYIAFMTMFFLGVVAWVLINKLVIQPWKIKINSQIGTLELNYQTKVGSEKETKAMWKTLQLKKFLWDGGSILFISLVLYYLLIGMKAWMEHISLYLLIMFFSVFLGLIFRLFCYLDIKQQTLDDTSETNSNQ